MCPDLPLAPPSPFEGDAEPSPQVAALAEALLRLGWQLATAESCTGGGIASACTDRPGSSAWFDRGFVTYSNAAKTELLGVDADLIQTHGAVSEAVARALAEGALARSAADLTVAVTGIAGPDGGVPGKPVGTVWFGLAGRHLPTRSWCVRFDGDRLAVRRQAVAEALGACLRACPGAPG